MIQATIGSGLAFGEAWPNRMLTNFDDEPAAVLSRGDLLKNKRASGRTQDLADVEWLESTDL